MPKLRLHIENSSRKAALYHVSCDDAERYVAISLDLWFANLARFVRGEPLAARVDPRLGY